MPRTALAIRHVHFEDLGAFAAPIEAQGYQIRTLDAGVDGLSAVDPFAAGRPGFGNDTAAAGRRCLTAWLAEVPA